MNDRKCSYCNKPLRKRYWFAILGSDNHQCDRILCRIKTGHLLFMMGYKIEYKWFKFRLPIKIKKRNSNGN